MNINYIKYIKGVAYIYPDCSKKFLSTLTAIKELSKHHLVDYSGYRKVIKKVLEIHRHIPIYLSGMLILFPTHSDRNYENIWINYMRIESTSFTYGHTIFTFDDQSSLEVQISQESYKKITNTIFKIIKYKESLV